MSDLVVFLRARLDEDQAVAQHANPGPWVVNDATYPESIYTEDRLTDVVAGGRWGGEANVFDTAEDAFHIARWDPARVLAEVQAKRAILELHICPCPNDCGDCGQCSGAHMADPVGFPCPTVKLIAVPYQDHPDYRQEWRP